MLRRHLCHIDILTGVIKVYLLAVSVNVLVKQLHLYYIA